MWKILGNDDIWIAVGQYDEFLKDHPKLDFCTEMYIIENGYKSGLIGLVYYSAWADKTPTVKTKCLAWEKKLNNYSAQLVHDTFGRNSCPYSAKFFWKKDRK